MLKMTENQNAGHEQRQVRLSKLKALEAKGINAYPQIYRPTATAASLAEKYADLQNDTQTQDIVSVAGRVRAIRNSGMFIDIYDSTGKVQIYTSKESSSAELLEMLDYLDVGDIIGVEGYVKRTKRGELSVSSLKMTMLSKALLPLPEKYHGLTDTDTKYRQRYLDMIMNPETTTTLVKRSQIITAIRSLLLNEGLLEVETPLLHVIKGGATAKPFITHHNALDMDLFLRVAPELYLKRLIVGGMHGVFEIGRNFRNEGIDTRHNPEFTMMEVYRQYNDYTDMMTLFEKIVETAALAVNGTTVVEIDGKTIDLKGPYPRKTMAELVLEHTGVDFMAIETDEEARATCEKLGVAIDERMDWGHCLSTVFEEKCEHHLVQPTHVIDHPKSISPLTKEHRDNPRLVERFETFINTWEMCNAYSELTNPIDQRERFEDQVKEREAGDDEADMMDEDFVTALEHGMPPTGGLGVGIDRLIMILTSNLSIRDIIAFPTMRKK
ncbi:MAG: lysine--tRNA ligase [Alphaproteobacteria bacterium]|nr:lysine--tRNA ligase [Alphaproteobacteria bacterium]MBQ8557204.1 lysine--tRNA ligase [Alphaproteobacteria bacterium]